MATTRTPLEAITYAKRFVKNFKIDDADLKIRVLNAASNKLHMFAPWSWAVEEAVFDTPPGELVNGTTDYDFVINSPDTYFSIIKAELFFTNENRIEPLRVVPSLPSQDRHNGTPKLITRLDEDTARLYPIPWFGSADLPDLHMWMRLVNPAIVETGGSGPATYNDDVSGGLLFPDEWFWVYEELVLAYAMRFADDSRAGSINFTTNASGNKAVEFTGQQGVAQQALEFMASKEDLLIEGIGEVTNG